MKIVLILLLASTAFMACDALLNKEGKMKCYTEVADKVKDEPDADLKEKITATLAAVKGVADTAKSLKDEQKPRIVTYYFTGACEPLKNFFQ